MPTYGRRRRRSSSRRRRRGSLGRRMLRLRSRSRSRRPRLALRGRYAGALRRAAPLTRTHDYPLATHGFANLQTAPDGAGWGTKVLTMSSPPAPTHANDPAHPMILYLNRVRISYSIWGLNGPGEFVDIQFYMVGDTNPRGGTEPSYVNLFRDHDDDRDKLTLRPGRNKLNTSRYFCVPVHRVRHSWGNGGATSGTLGRPKTGDFSFKPPSKYGWARFPAKTVPDPTTVAGFPEVGTSWFLVMLYRFADGTDNSYISFAPQLHYQWKGY